MEEISFHYFSLVCIVLREAVPYDGASRHN